MVCRCRTHEEHAARAVQSVTESARYEAERSKEEIRKLKAEIANLTPDNSKYEILEVEEVSKHLVLKVKYIGCNCSYEGVKVMVFLNACAKDALKWKKIDPHFREKDRSPAARFPATLEGWNDAIAFASYVDGNRITKK